MPNQKYDTNKFDVCAQIRNASVTADNVRVPDPRNEEISGSLQVFLGCTHVPFEEHKVRASAVKVASKLNGWSKTAIRLGVRRPAILNSSTSCHSKSFIVYCWLGYDLSS